MSVKAHGFGTWKGPQGNVHTLKDLQKKLEPATTPETLVSPSRMQSLCSWRFIRPILLALGLILAALISLAAVINSGVALSGGIGVSLALQILLLASGIAWLFMHIRTSWRECR